MFLRLEIIGNLGSDADLRVIENGRQVLTFSVAHTEKWKKADGTQAEKTYWVKCNYWFGADNKVNIKQYLVKGTLVRIEGMPEVSSWIKDGESFATQEVTVHSLRLLGGGASSTPNEPKNVPGVTAPPIPKEDNDDLPF